MSKPVFTYISGCCGAPSKKTAVLLDKKTKEEKGANSSLGKWRCSNCGNRTKVTRKNAND